MKLGLELTKTQTTFLISPRNQKKDNKVGDPIKFLLDNTLSDRGTRSGSFHNIFFDGTQQQWMILHQLVISKE
jgi:hypothetical protein